MSVSEKEQRAASCVTEEHFVISEDGADIKDSIIRWNIVFRRASSGIATL